MSNRRRRRSFRRRDTIVSVPIDELDDYLTPADVAAMRRVADLEAAGDLDGALQCLRRCVRAVGAPHEHQLQEMLHLGDAAPQWVWGRWLCGAAYRWGLLEEDPRVRAAALEVGAATYDVRELSRGLGVAVGACDALAQDAVLFDLGLLDDYLDLRAGDLVLDRAGCVRSWGTQPMTVVQFAGLREDRLLVTDHVRSRQVEVLHTGEAMGTERDEWLVGRLVAGGETEQLVFAGRPIPVGERAGRRLVPVLSRGGDWHALLETLYTAIGAGELPPRPGWLAGAAGLSSTASLREVAYWRRRSQRVDGARPAPRERQLMAEGLSRQTAAHVCVLELALEVAAAPTPGAVEMVAQHAGIALMWPEVRREAVQRLGGPRHQAAWRRLAACLPPHARAPFDELAGAA